LDGLLNRNLDVTRLEGGLGHHYSLGDRDLHELRNHLALNALWRNSAILSRESTETSSRESGITTNERGRNWRGNWCGRHQDLW
jgi:hypothetical protein